MKRRIVLLLATIMTISVTACGENSSQSEVGEGISGEIIGNGEEAEGEENAESTTGLGLRDIEYHGINSNGTDTDKLAFLQDNRVFVLNFGDGSDIVSGLGINENGLFGTLDSEAQIAFGLDDYVLNEAPEFVIKTQGFTVSTNLEISNDLYIPDGAEVIEASDGSYTIASYPDFEGAYNVRATLEDGYTNAVFEVRNCDSTETAEKFAQYMQKNLKYYYLESRDDISMATDRNGEEVDLTSYIFFRDVLAKSIAEKFGLNVKSHKALMNCTRSVHDLDYDGAWEVDFDGSLYETDGIEPVDFMGYKAYVVPGEKLYLQYGEDACIEIEPNYYSENEIDILKEVEKKLFSNEFPEEE